MRCYGLTATPCPRAAAPPGTGWEWGRQAEGLGVQLSLGKGVGMVVL